jgi:hypothetical protein
MIFRLDPRVVAFKKTIGALAWGTFAWLALEPENLLHLYEGHAQPAKTLAE